MITWAIIAAAFVAGLVALWRGLVAAKGQGETMVVKADAVQTAKVEVAVAQAAADDQNLSPAGLAARAKVGTF